ncbi:MAG: hypothetical protein IKV93_01860 [Alphaproteobacteria bacterium]|nr:hypothetical protein [Alphaproteobacteria bacterium]
MKRDGVGVKAVVGTQPTARPYVFFCEGRSEFELVKLLNQKIKDVSCGDKANYVLWAYKLPDLEPSDTWYFTPQRILDYMIGVWNRVRPTEKKSNSFGIQYNYRNVYGVSNLNEHAEQLVKQIKDTKEQLCLFVDLDVFYKKGHNNYGNITNSEQKVKDRKYQKHLLTEFRDNNWYRFVGQSLNLEDFIALFSFENNDYETWFTSRFGKGIRVKDNNNDDEPKEGTLGNNNVNGEKLKEEFRNFGKKPKDYVRNLQAQLNTAKMRMKNNKKDRYGWNGWPYKFDLVDMLASMLNCNIKKGDDGGQGVR